MSGQRLLGLPALLILVSGCASLSMPPENSIVPQNGPRTKVHASYSGGLHHRQVSASVKVDQHAYVVVGHLGGDGVIRVLYPGSALEQKPVQAGKTVRTPTTFVQWDVTSTMFLHTVSPFRNFMSRMDSYDGTGHGYIFAITSPEPLWAKEVVSGDGRWAEMAVEDYFHANDPRLSVRDFADLLADGAPYTVKFAEAFTTMNFGNFATRRERCYAFGFTLPIALGLSAPSFPLYRTGFGSHYSPGCSSYDNWWFSNPFRYASAPSGGVTPQPPQPGRGSRTFTRPTLRNRGDRGRALSFTRPTTSGRTATPRTSSTWRRDYGETRVRSGRIAERHDGSRMSTPRSAPAGRVQADAPRARPERPQGQASGQAAQAQRPQKGKEQ